MGREQAQLLQQEDFVVLSAVLHEARAAALASSASTADGDVDLSLLEVCMRQCPHPRCARARPAPTLLPAARRATQSGTAARAMRPTSAQVLRAYEAVLPAHGKSVQEDSHYYRLVLLPPRTHRRPASIPPPLSLLTDAPLSPRAVAAVEPERVDLLRVARMPGPRHLRLRLARHLRPLAQVAADAIARPGRACGAATRTQPGARRAVRGGNEASQCEAC